MWGPSRVTMTEWPRRLRASSSRSRACRRSPNAVCPSSFAVEVEGDLDAPLVAVARLSLFVVGHSPGTLSPVKGPAPTPFGPRLWTGVEPIALSHPHESWMWPQTATRGLTSSIAAAIAGLPSSVPEPSRSQWPRGGEWRTSTASSGQSASRSAAASSSRSKLQSHGVVGIPAPRPKKVTPSSSAESAVQHRRGLPVLRGLAERVLGLVVAGHEEGRRLDRGQRADRVVEALVDRGEVAGADHDVEVARALDEARRRVEVHVQVAEREGLHRGSLTRSRPRT